MRILIVDDEEAFAESLAQRLRLRGMDAAVAGDATQALAALDGDPWDIIFLDVCLPGMDGVSLLKILRERCADVDVVMLSGATEMGKAVQAMRRGARNWLSKPVALEAVLEECRKARERAEARRRAARLTEEARWRSLGRIAEGVAHEVNNPLNIIVQAAGMVSDCLEGPEADALPDVAEARDALRVIVKQSLRVREITRTLLMAGKGLDPRTGPLDAPAVARRVLGLLQGRMEQQNVRCELSFPDEDAPRPHGSPLELEQVLLHLLENALDAMPDGGLLRVSAEIETDKDGETDYVLRVSDSGPGIAADILPHIFEPFFTTHRERKAAGLGLAVARGLVVKRGGTLEAVPSDAGACFVARLPLERQTSLDDSLSSDRSDA